MIGDYILTQETHNGTEEVRIPGELPILFASGISDISNWKAEGEGIVLSLKGTDVYVTNPSKVIRFSITGNLPEETSLDFTKLPNLRQIFLQNTPLRQAPIVAGLPRLDTIQFTGNRFQATPDLTMLPNLEVLGLTNDAPYLLTTVPELSGSPYLKKVFMSNHAFPSVDGILASLANNVEFGPTAYGYVVLQGNSIQTPASTAAIFALNARKWTVRVNGIVLCNSRNILYA